MIPEVRVGATDNGDDMDGIVGFEVGLALYLVVGAIVIVIGALFFCSSSNPCIPHNVTRYIDLKVPTGSFSIGGVDIAILGCFELNMVRN